jgi:glycogen operon protein
VNALRERQKRNLLMTLLLSQGVPMLRGGDELGQTQGGNNNAYCQDNETSWLHWDLTPAQQSFLEFTRRVIRLRRTHPVFHRRRFFQGRSIRGAEIEDISWFAPDGREMTDEAWTAPFVRSLGVRLAGDAIGEMNERGERVTGDTMLLLLNADANPLAFTLPEHGEGRYWEELDDTANGVTQVKPLHGGDQHDVQGRSMAVFRLGVPKRRRRTDGGPTRQIERFEQPEIPEPAMQAAAMPDEEPQPVAVGEHASNEPAVAR